MTPETQVPHLVTALTGPLKTLEKHLLSRQVTIETWFRQRWQQTPPPFYSSVDLRNAGFKLAPVDTNLFPAGFNNLNPETMSLCVQAAQATIAEICPEVTRLLIIPESHTRNMNYFESVATLRDILMGAGVDTRIGFIGESLSEAQEYTLPSGRKLRLEPLIREGDRVGVEDFFPCCVVLNNDLSSGVPEILENLSQRIMPSMQLGWTQRLKSEHFRHYEEVALAFSKEMDLDPWLLTPWFDQCPEVDFMRKEGQDCLKRRAEALFKRIQKKYDEYDIKEKPFLVVKADQGTYGMAVLMIKDPSELMTLNRKKRTHMSTLKGGAQVTRAIIQEGVYSFETYGAENSVAEPVVYMMGRHVIGGFYRVHDNRGPDENLNAPGMNFHPLAFAQPCNMPCENSEKEANRFYAYGVVARLALLAAGKEFAAFQEGAK